MIPLTTDLSKDAEEARIQQIDNYQQLASLSNGRLEEWTPTMYGSTTHGTPTYNTQQGLYFIQGVMTDIWFAINWATAGSAAGNLTLDLPVIISKGPNWVFPLIISAVSLTANYTHISIQVINNTATGLIYEVSATSGLPMKALTWAKTSGTIWGHIRVPIKRDLSRR